MATLAEQVDAFCEQHALLQHGATVVVAVSGGPDSLCLLHLLRVLAPPRQLSLHVAHLDHRLRPESAEDARFVAQIAAAWHLPISIGREDVAAIAAETHIGIEATARDIRARFLVEVALPAGATTIALGHTADDQAETVLLRLLRGAGPSGLAAMRPKRLSDPALVPDQPPRQLIRPLLATSRAGVEAYCAEHGLTPRHDPSNELPIFLRNRVRGYILPLLKTYNPSIVATLGRTARICAEEDDLLNDLMEQAWAQIATVDATGVTFDRPGFERLHAALQRRILRKAVALMAASVELEATHTDLALAAITANRRRVQLPHGVWLQIGRAYLRLTTDDRPSETR